MKLLKPRTYEVKTKEGTVMRRNRQQLRLKSPVANNHVAQSKSKSVQSPYNHVESSAPTKPEAVTPNPQRPVTTTDTMPTRKP